MRAIVFNGETAEIRNDVEVRKPGPNEVLARVRATAICGTDAHLIHGDYPGFWPPAFPFTPGHEWAGEIVALGPGAEAFGWRGAYWTTRRVAQLIGDQFGVYYHPAHVSRLLRQIGWSCQKPITRAAQRDPAAVSAWAEERLPAIQKKRPPKGAPSSG